jgi:hypothetical protein
MDHDDLWHREHLGNLHAALSACAEIPAVESLIAPFRDNAPPDLDGTIAASEMFDPWAFTPFRNPIRTPTGVLIRRAALEEVGGWDERMAAFPITIYGCGFRRNDHCCGYGRPPRVIGTTPLPCDSGCSAILLGA